MMVASRLLCATADPHRYEVVTAALQCGDHVFTAKGNTITNAGWKEVQRRFYGEDGENGDEKQAPLPTLREGQQFEDVSSSVTEHTTTPPKPYTEDTLLSAMESASSDEVELPPDAERKGLGTPATRASIIEKLIASGYVRRNKKQLLPTDEGQKLISILPQRLKSPKLTAEWENALTQIARGQLDADLFMNDISGMVSDLVKQTERADADLMSHFVRHEDVIGICPRCGRTVVENMKGFFCTDRVCGFAMWKQDKFFMMKRKALTKQIATNLLMSGKVKMDNLYSEKTGKTYSATVLLDDTGTYVNYKTEFGSTPKPANRTSN